jgi:hypothetical protein
MPAFRSPLPWKALRRPSVSSTSQKHKLLSCTAKGTQLLQLEAVDTIRCTCSLQFPHFLLLLLLSPANAATASATDSATPGIHLGSCECQLQCRVQEKVHVCQTWRMAPSGKYPLRAANEFLQVPLNTLLNGALSSLIYS